MKVKKRATRTLSRFQGWWRPWLLFHQSTSLRYPQKSHLWLSLASMLLPAVMNTDNMFKNFYV
jgi:hypothetical protein